MASPPIRSVRYALSALGATMVFASFAIGCGASDDDDSESSSGSTEHPSRGPSDRAERDLLPPEQPPATPEPSAEDSAAARALLQAWSLAQNGSDFAAYGELYGPGFVGIKRSGERVSRFERAGWLEDRERMFRRPMEVTVSDLRVAQRGAVIELRFHQRWSSPTYADEGEKVLLVARDDGRQGVGPLRIVREEMLSSSASSDSAEELHGFRFLLERTAPHVILPDAGGAQPVRLDSGSPAAPELLDRRGPWVTRVEVDPGSVPAEARLETSRGYVVVDAQGGTCFATVEGLYLARRVTPHFSDPATWSGDPDGDGEPETAPYDALSLALAAWHAGESGQVLVGELSLAPGCESPLYALAANGEGTSEAITYVPTEETDADPGTLRAATRMSATYRALQRSYEADGGQGGWADRAPDDQLAAFKSAQGESLVVTHTVTDGEGCGEFTASVLQVYRRVGATMGPAPVDVALFSPRVVAAVDLGADGIPELLVRESGGDLVLLAVRRGAYRVVAERRAPNYDCAC